MNLVLACALLAPVQPTHNLYVGTYNSPISEGIYRLSFDTATGKLGEPALAAKMTNPSFVAIHPDGKKLYAVGEVGESGKRKGGAVAAFELSPKGDLKPINDQSTVGGGPCHITLNPDGTTVLVANYGGGSVVSYKVGPDGGLGEPASFIQHKGASVNKQRQEASRPLHQYRSIRSLCLRR
jgi:6-phosphogluconolactonase